MASASLHKVVTVTRPPRVASERTVRSTPAFIANSRMDKLCSASHPFRKLAKLPCPSCAGLAAAITTRCQPSPENSS